MHVYFYNYEYWEGDREMVDSGVVKGENAIGPIEETQILTIAPFTSLGTPLEIIRAFGGKSQYEHAVNELEQALYSA